jgi:hypothetical protein
VAFSGATINSSPGAEVTSLVKDHEVIWCPVHSPSDRVLVVIAG